ncbi:MAG: RdgB/HAM1 family non-canonical purine NTP pyrophosphatase [Candidatus Amulumruptor caecigallinarius]|nr:RdgB/HAM1 family non-canonical purine NTP pyrophosphatase [Candidatus Amulumruptor caecigallinarius]MCM1397019.1 RdgB/HAM1 family non-canonical purine NTP pyrophosphatase [Candidatus Amulumruptor caecigallinarius]MCM1454044.1 RdgB/HAM1 family non-canonical purine NTP pyrophosphatase [bacterium]
MTLPTLIVATGNSHKLSEFRRILGDRFNLLGLKDLGCTEEIPETGDTLEENARQKAMWVKERYGHDCIADDTGLMVDALGGEPGVRSARYAGPDHDAEANMRLLLSRLDGVANRSARFRTVIALTEGPDVRCFTGSVEGEILTAPDGDGGFGYDPVFRPAGYTETFARMSPDEKNAISHRARATASLLSYLDR